MSPLLSLLPLLVAGASAASPPCPPGGGPPAATGTVADPSLDEISGLVALGPDDLWILEDSGNPADLTELSASGATKRTVHLVGVENEDWEDLSVGPCPSGRCLYVADIGDNKARRPFVRVLRVAVPEAGATSARPEILPFRYPDGPQNAEGLVVDAEGRLTVFTKRKDDVTRVYRVPASFGAAEPVTAEPRGELPAGAPGITGPLARVTGAALTDDGWLLLRGYHALFAFPPEGDRWSAGGRVTLPSAEEPQGEAVAWGAGGYWQASENGAQGIPTVIFRRVCQAGG